MGTRRPRYRYIAFRVDGPRSYRREEIVEAFQFVTPRLWLAVFDGARGLVRTTNIERDAAIHAIVDIDVVAGDRVRIQTMGTSGTIRSAMEKFLKPHGRTRQDAEKNPYK
jgi:RNase P/RNase MRP subunit POP5